MHFNHHLKHKQVFKQYHMSTSMLYVPAKADDPYQGPVFCSEQLDDQKHELCSFLYHWSQQETSNDVYQHTTSYS